MFYRLKNSKKELKTWCSRRTFLITFILILIIGCINNYAYAQSKLNYGLAKPQDKSTLPKSNSPVPDSKRKVKTKTVSVLKPIGANTYSLESGWELISADKIEGTGELVSGAGFPTSEWLNATVPGTVLTTLVDQGVYPDPFYGLNNLIIPDSICRKEWWYRVEFKIPNDTESKVKWLEFKGINYRADIWVNQHLVGSIDGAFKRGKFNVTDVLKSEGLNSLAVKIYPPPHPGIPHEESEIAGPGRNGGLLCLDGPTFISSEGWDWIPGIRDRNIGIWQDVRFIVTGPVIISDPQVIADLPLPDTTRAAIQVKVRLINTTNREQTGKFTGRLEQRSFESDFLLQPGETKDLIFSPTQYPGLNLENPKLWWPNGYGPQEMYTAELSVMTDGKVSDQRNVRFGIRELSYELTAQFSKDVSKRVLFEPVNDLKQGKPVFDNKNRKDIGQKVSIPSLKKDIDPGILKVIPEDGMGPYLVIRVNGQRIFCRGGNWGMDDGMKRVSRERLEPYFRLHKEANFNMIRNWTGESTEEVFYELADEYGLLVWNDFWISTEGVNLPPLDENLFLDNVRDVVRRFRNHPSIAVWCPRNEGFAPDILEDKLSQLIATEDGTRLYQGNSRILNLRISGPWNYMSDPKIYYTKIANGFSTELGSPSVPTAASMRKMMPEKDLWPVSDVWHYHDFHKGQKKYMNAIDSLYGVALNLEDFCKKAQFINYDSYRAMFESWNSKLWKNTSGLLLWMTHPAWPSTVWQAYSWDYETFGSFYGVKKACEPVHIQMNLHDKKVIGVNTTLNEILQAKAILKIFSLQGKILFKKEKQVNLPANQIVQIFETEIKTDYPEVCLVRLSLQDKNGKIISQNDYWETNTGNYRAFNHLKNAAITVKNLKKRIQGNIMAINCNLENHENSPVVNVKVNIANENNDIVLPCYISDGYFNLMPGESKNIEIKFTPGPKNNYKIVLNGYNLKEQIFQID